MTVALVSGSHGFVGSHLRPVLREAGWRVVGMGRAPVAATYGEVYVQADVTDVRRVLDVIAGTRPDVVFHLAASPRAPASDPAELTRTSVAGVAALCEAIRRLRLATRLVLAGSSAQYGSGPIEGRPVTETMPCRPVNAYGEAKLAAEALAFSLAERAALDLIAVRAFNHVGPGEPPTTVAGAVARRVREIVDGRRQRFQVMDPSVVRDFTDVRDVARGYLALAERGASGRVYNLCSGRGQSVRDVVDGLLAAAGLDWSVADLLPDTGVGVQQQIGSPKRIQSDTGWIPGIKFEDSLADLLGTIVERTGVR